MAVGSELLSDVGRSGIQIFTGEVIWNVGDIADGNEATADVTVTGANMGDFVLVSSSLDVKNLSLVGQVTAAGVVTVQLGNWTGGTLDVLTPTIHVMVFTKG
jgi:hypothetical protein